MKISHFNNYMYIFGQMYKNKEEKIKELEEIKANQIDCFWFQVCWITFPEMIVVTGTACVILFFLLPLRDVIKRIDQSEFEGFEYINPLLLSAEESVWRREQLPLSPTFCLSKQPSSPKIKPPEANCGRQGGRPTHRRNVKANKRERFLPGLSDGFTE